MEQYFYLLWSGLFLLIWLLLFIHRRDTRREMLIVSSLFAIGGPVADKVYLNDYWHPMTITGTSVGIEGILIGFAIGGIASVIYEELYRKRLIKDREHHGKYSYIYNGFLLLSFPLIFLSSFFLLGINSFYSTVLASCIFIGYMFFSRRDLIADSLVSGSLMLVMGISMYFLLFLAWPGYVHAFWVLSPHWYTYLLFGIPVEEYFWYFLIGAYIGPLYEFLSNRKLST